MTFTLKLCLVFKFGVINWFYKSNHKVCQKKVSRKIQNIYEVLDLSLSFILNFEVSGQSFKGEVHLNRFDCKKSKLACGFVIVACHIML